MTRWTRLDWALAASATALALATRAAVRTTGYYSVDAGLLAVGALDYDFADYQPHPPYYPLGVFLVRAVMAATPLDPLAALTWLCVAASGALAACTYALGRGVGGRWAGTLAALLVVASPVALRNGGVPLSYALEGAASAAVAAVAWPCHEHASSRRAIALGVAASLAVGLRPSGLVLVAPLLVWATWRDRRAMAWTVAAGAATTLAWAVPMLVAGGGLAAFLDGVAYQSRAYVLSDPVWSGGWGAVQEHLRWLAFHLRRGLPFLAALAATSLVAGFGVARNWPRPATTFLLAWMLPGLAFYVLVYAGWPVYPDGYLMALVPGFAVLCALLLQALAKAVTAEGVPRAARSLGVAVVAGLALQPAGWVLAWDDAMEPAREAEAWEASMAGLETAFPANETALFTFVDGPWARLRHPDHLLWTAQVYLGDDGLVRAQLQEERGGHVASGFFENVADGPGPLHPVPPWVRRVVLVEGHPQSIDFQDLRPEVERHTTTLPGGREVTWFDPSAYAHVEDALALFALEPRPPAAPRYDPPA